MQISYNGWTSYVTNNYFYSHIPLEGLLCGAESDSYVSCNYYLARRTNLYGMMMYGG